MAGGHWPNRALEGRGGPDLAGYAHDEFVEAYGADGVYEVLEERALD
jgi:hypothetical protein